jgi:Phage capsid family
MSSVSLLPRGTWLMRGAIAQAIATSQSDAELIASQRWGARGAAVARAAGEIGMIQRADAVTTFNSPSAELAFRDSAREFVEAVTVKSIVGRLPNLRRVPPMTRMIGQTSSAAASWVAEPEPFTIGKLGFDGVSLQPRKLVASAVFSRELAQSNAAAAELIIRNDLINVCAAALDVAFLSPSNAGDAATPASITNGVSVASGGTLASVLGGFDGNLELAVFIANPVTYAGLASTTNLVGLRDSELLAAPALVCSRNALPDGVLVVADPSAIVYSGSDVASIAAATHALLDLGGSSPSTPTFSLWQKNCIALAATIFCNWAVGRPGAVALIDGVA